MGEEVRLYFSEVRMFNALPISIQEDIVSFFSGDECLGVDVGDVSCALNAGDRCEVFHTVESFCSFLSKNKCKGIVSYKTPLNTIEDLSSWLESFQRKVESDVVSAAMFSLFSSSENDYEFYIAVF